MNKRYLILVLLLGLTTVSAQKALTRESIDPTQQTSTNEQVSRAQRQCPATNLQIPVNQHDYNKLSRFSFSGWYLGSSLGAAQTYVKSINTFQTDYDKRVLKTANGLVSETSLSGRNVRGSLYGGYGYQQQSLYLGVEGESTLQNIKSTQTINLPASPYSVLLMHNISATLKESYCLSFKGGYVFDSENLLYLKIGAVYSRWMISSVYPAFVNRSSIKESAIYNTQKRQFGFQSGAGFEKALNKNFIAGAEVTYSLYKKTCYDHPHMNRGSITPSVFSFNLRLTYKFDSF